MQIEKCIEEIENEIELIKDILLVSRLLRRKGVKRKI